MIGDTQGVEPGPFGSRRGRGNVGQMIASGLKPKPDRVVVANWHDATVEPMTGSSLMDYLQPTGDGSVERWAVGDLELMRVRYFDIAVGFDTLSLPADGPVPGQDWPAWTSDWTDNGLPAVGQVFWVIRSDDNVVVVDPCGAADPFLRVMPDAIGHQDAAFAALASAGIDRADVTHVILTHRDGIGMTAWFDADGMVEPAFASAKIHVTSREHAAINEFEGIGGRDHFLALDAAGHVHQTPNVFEVCAGVTMRFTGGHSAGHAVVELTSNNHRAVLIGHLATSPLAALVGPLVGLHADTDAGARALAAELAAAHADGALVAGALWPTPGVGRVTSRDPWVVTPA